VLKKLLYGLMLACLTLPSWADKLYVRNKLFEGYLTGSVRDLNSLEVDINEFARALGSQVEEVDGNWLVRVPQESGTGHHPSNAKKLYINGREVGFRQDYERKLVKLQAVAEALGGRLVRHPEVGTIDFNLLPTKTTGYDPTQYHLIYFGADWAPAAKLFKPVVVQLDLKDIVPVIYVDCTQPRSANYKNFIRYFNGDRIPYTVLLNPKNRVVKTWTGYHDLGPFQEQIQEELSKP